MILTILITIVLGWLIYIARLIKRSKLGTSKNLGFLLPIVIGFLVLVILTILFENYYSDNLEGGTFFRNSLGINEESFITSMWQDILFFGLVGVTLVIIQSHHYYRNLNLRSRIDMLFNRKTLTDSEVQYLEIMMQDCGIYGVSDYVRMEIKDIATEKFTSGGETKAVEVMYFELERTFKVGNLLDDVTGHFKPEFSISPDPLPDNVKVAGELMKSILVNPGSERNIIVFDACEYDAEGMNLKAEGGFDIVGEQELNFLSRYSSFQILENEFVFSRLLPYEEKTIEIVNDTGYPLKLVFDDGKIKERTLGKVDNSVKIIEKKRLPYLQKVTIKMERIND